MFEPVRGGTRGGQAEFKWSDVAADKDRENYLGHSINAPAGRWQKNKDIHWYSRDKNDDEEAMREEIRKVKEQEAEALAAALGFAPGSKSGGSNVAGGTSATGANAIAVPTTAAESTAEQDAKKEEKRKRKEEKRLKKERRKAEKEEEERSGRRHHRHRSHSRSRSPRRRDREDRSRSLHRSRTPPRRDRDSGLYDNRRREVERDRPRQRWDDNARREQAAARSRGN